jgi:hypothetical protein
MGMTLTPRSCHQPTDQESDYDKREQSPEIGLSQTYVEASFPAECAEANLTSAGCEPGAKALDLSDGSQKGLRQPQDGDNILARNLEESQ